MINKRLQVFISSTYKDLIEERQAAVQAILSAGHIPAGMELFSAGDKSQMSVIKEWINQSDIFLLILGGSYGSIEPTSGKSYIQIEYEYALQLNKPLFSIVIHENYLEEKVKHLGTAVIEKEHQKELSNFRNLVLSKMVRFFEDTKDIKVSIFETLSDFSKREDLIGWVPGNQKAINPIIAEEITRLSEENSKLLKENFELQKQKNAPAIKNLSNKRRGYVIKSSIDGKTVIFNSSEFSDGSLGEINIDMPMQDNLSRNLLTNFGAAVSIGLQYGVPLLEYVNRFVDTKFEPSGNVDHPNILKCSSVLDYLFRSIGYEYLGLVELVDKQSSYNFEWDMLDDTDLSNVRVTVLKPSTDYKTEDNADNSDKADDDKKTDNSTIEK